MWKMNRASGQCLIHRRFWLDWWFFAHINYLIVKQLVKDFLSIQCEMNVVLPAQVITVALPVCITTFEATKSLRRSQA